VYYETDGKNQELMLTNIRIDENFKFVS